MSAPDPTDLVERRLSALEVALMAGGVTVFLAMLFVLRDFLNPFILVAAGTILLWPLRDVAAAKALFLSALFLLTLYALNRLSVVLTPFVLAYVLAYLFNPLVDLMNDRFRLPRWLPSMVVTILVVGLIALFFLLLVPSVVGQLEVLASRVANGVGDLRETLVGWSALDRMDQAGILDKQEFITQLTSLISDQAGAIATRLPRTAESLVRSIGSLLGFVAVIAIMPVLVFYMLRDYRIIRTRIAEVFPRINGSRDYLDRAGSVVGSYLRGQLTISAIAAFNVSLLLIIFDVPFALLIGILGGFLNMIPNLGIIITNIIGILIAVVFGDPWFAKALVVFAVLMGESILESTLLTPQIMSQQVGLHPVLILLSLFVFGSLMGFFGLLIAVPAAALMISGYNACREDIMIAIFGHDAIDKTSDETGESEAEGWSPSSDGGPAELAPAVLPESDRGDQKDVT